MKIKLLIIFLIAIVLSNTLVASNFKDLALFAKEKEVVILSKSVKIGKKASVYKRTNALAAVAPPTVVAGSSCGPGTITLSATGAKDDIIEWFANQESTTPVATGNIYSPTLSVTTTYYVSARLGSVSSTRVPVVASVYNMPPQVKLTAYPANNPTNPLCLGTTVTFTAEGGANLFEFSVDGHVVQEMGTNPKYVTNTLTNKQVVSVKSRYEVKLDGTLTDKAWGTGPLEDNVLSAGKISTLSGNASTGYINALKISPTEDSVVIGIAGKALNYRRIMVFLDTKPGGFNVSNYGDENGSFPNVRAFNYFNNNPSTFDSYFAADYCVAIATDAGETSYYADVIELKTGFSTKTYLGTAATGLSTRVMGVDKGNTGTSDYDKGFEVTILRSLIGLPKTKDSAGNDVKSPDIKFFAFTMQDNDVSNYNVTNSFLSPATRGSDYGNGAVDYNSEAPNPVVVGGAALTPCYSGDSMTMYFAENPTVATVGKPQSVCSLTSASLGGNTPIVGTGAWTKKSGPGTVSFSDSTLGNSTATVSVAGDYVFTWTISSGQCSDSSADVTVKYNVIPEKPTGYPKTECETSPIQTLTATATVSSGTIVWYDDLIAGNIVPNPIRNSVGSVTYYAQNNIGSCSSARTPVTLQIKASPFLDVKTKTCSADLLTYSVEFAAASGSVITRSPVVGVITGNFITGIPKLTNIVITADNGNGCKENYNVTAPNCSCAIIANPKSDGDKSVCEGQANPILSATVNPGETIDWYSDISGGVLLENSPTYLPTVTLPGVYTYYAQARNIVDACISSSRTPVALSINSQPKPTALTTQPFCESQNATVGDLKASGTGVKWYANTNGGTPLPVTVPLVAGEDYYASQTATTGLHCESFEKLKVIVAINKPAAPTGPSPVVFCNSATVADLEVSGTNVRWYDSLGNLLTLSDILKDGVYSATQTVDGCESVSRLYVTVTINKPSGIIIDHNQIFCESEKATVATLTARVSAGVNVKWYSSATISTPLDPTTSLGNSLYYGSQTVSGCESTPRVEVDVKINAPSSPTGDRVQFFCLSESATVGDLKATATGSIIWYDPAVPAIPLPATTPLANGKKYYATQKVLDCESVNNLEVLVVIFNPLMPELLNQGEPRFCDFQHAKLSDIILKDAIDDSKVIWYDAGGAVLSPDTEIVLDGVYYAAHQFSEFRICESGRLQVHPVLGKQESPAMVEITQPRCNKPSGSALFTGLPTGNWTITPSLGTPVTSSGGTFLFENLVGSTDYTFKVANATNCTSYSKPVSINAIPTAPPVPNASINQPTCAIPSGTVTIAAPQTGMEYSLDGILYKDNGQFSNLAPNNYKLRVRLKNDTSCETFGSDQLVTAIPSDIQFESSWTCESNKYELSASPLSNSYDKNAVEYIWKDQNGNIVGTNSNVLHVSEVIEASAIKETFPLVYTLTVKSSATGCATTANVMIESIYCDIQKGISPDGNGSNDYLDLRLMDVKNLEVFNRYGIQVYSQPNYTDQWYGQTNNGASLPSGTYYYVIDFNNGQSKTGWIYLIREN